MKIFITNDDGWNAPGLSCLREMMENEGEIRSIAPSEHQSGMSMAVSLGVKQLKYTPIDAVSGHLNGTPATCVKYALDRSGLGLLPDIVVSGVNHGSNAATAACYSGTLGACQEAVLNGVRAIGVSIDAMTPSPDFTAVRKFFPGLFRMLVENYPDRHGLFYNVNFPNIPADEIKGVRFGHMGLGYWDLEFVPNEDAPGTYKMKGTFIENAHNDEESDHRLLRNGYISVTPHRLDTTDYGELERLKSLFLQSI